MASAGREHRDYATLARACAELPVRVFVAAGSLHSPSARQEQPMAWPANFRSGFADHLALRSLYTRASVVVVPLVPNGVRAGVRTILEATAMGKAVVVSATDGQRDVAKDAFTGVVVAPGDPRALRDAQRALLQNAGSGPGWATNARALVESRFSMTAYADRLAQHLRAVASAAAATGTPV